MLLWMLAYRICDRLRIDTDHDAEGWAFVAVLCLQLVHGVDQMKRISLDEIEKSCMPGLTKNFAV